MIRWLDILEWSVLFISAADASDADSAVPDETIDPYDLMDAVDILPLVPKDFFERIVRYIAIIIRTTIFTT